MLFDLLVELERSCRINKMTLDFVIEAIAFSKSVFRDDSQFEQIRFARMYDHGEDHPPLSAAFVKGELKIVRMNDALDTVEWSRNPGESAEAFENRVIEDLRALAEGRPIDGMATTD
jgi:hypothetical protein